MKALPPLFKLNNYIFKLNNYIFKLNKYIFKLNNYICFGSRRILVIRQNFTAALIYILYFILATSIT